MIEDFLMFGGTLADQWRPDWADLDFGFPAPGDAREFPWAAFARDGDPGWREAPATMQFDRVATVGDDPLRTRLASLPQTR